MAIQLTLELHHLFLLQFIYEIYLFYVFGNKKLKTIFHVKQYLHNIIKNGKNENIKKYFM